MRQWRFAVLFLVLSVFGRLRAETILVIPFFNQTKSSNLDWIGESIADTVRESLASAGVLALGREERLEALRRQSLRPSAVLTLASIMKVGESLDASIVVWGHYELQPPAANSPAGSRGTLSITARVLNLKRLRPGPEFTESGALERLGLLEARVSWRTLDLLAPKAASSEDAFLRNWQRVRLDAMESYIRGLLASNPEEQRRLFLQAARLDAGYSQPCFQLGISYWRRKDYRAAAGWLKRVSQTDPHYLESQFFLGLCDYQLADYAAAEKCFQTVAATVPLNEVYNDLGAAQSRRDLSAAIASFQKAVEGDRTDPDYHFNLACALWQAGQFAEAAKSLRAGLQQNPDDQEAAALLIRVERHDPAPAASLARQRLKTNYEETAYRQLKAELESKKN
jgi:tetratricopeptide (TPR) repeat protein